MHVSVFTEPGYGGNRKLVQLLKRPSGKAGIINDILGQAEADGLTALERAMMIQSGLNEAAKWVQNEARRRVRVKTGTLRKAIKSRRRPLRNVTSPSPFHDYARVRIDAKLAPHWHLIEWGRKAGTAKSGHKYGSAPAYPYITPAYRDNADVLEQIVYVESIKAYREILRRKAR